jgi:site-specific DNA-cytosine methylase
MPGAWEMKVLELFCGTKSLSNVAKERGHEVFTVDIESKFNPDLCIDILDLTPEMIIEKFGRPDFIWASPPCTTFSVASIYRYWENGKPKNEKTLLGIKIVQKTIELIKALNPTYWLIENPRGMLRKQDFMFSLSRNTVAYCQYGSKIQKPTDLWNNLNHKFKPMCKPGSPCHEKASRGSRNGVQGINNSFSNLGSKGKELRAVVPKELCEEVIKHIESQLLERGSGTEIGTDKDSAPLNIEQPMQMNLREAQAWQLGWEIGFKAGEESERKKNEKER